MTILTLTTLTTICQLPSSSQAVLMLLLFEMGVRRDLHRNYLGLEAKASGIQVQTFFLEFPVTPSHYLSINQLGVTEAYFSCHAPITHTYPCDGNVTGKKPSCHA